MSEMEMVSEAPTQELSSRLGTPWSRDSCADRARPVVVLRPREELTRELLFVTRGGFETCCGGGCPLTGAPEPFEIKGFWFTGLFGSNKGLVLACESGIRGGPRGTVTN